MSVEEVVAAYPRLFHMTAADAWASIRAYGLQSAAALVERFDAPSTVVSRRRPQEIRLGGTDASDGAVLRDNGVLDDARLKGCLIDMDVPDFYRMLNGRVYLWPSRHRVDGLLTARAYRDRSHLVLTLDTATLLARHGDRVRLSPINMGSTLFTPTPRGRDTALGLADYPFAARRRLRGRRDAVAEVSVEHEVPDAADLVLTAVVHHPDGRRETVA